MKQPHYISLESKEREELLSQIGTFSPGERDVFHKLCDNWQPRIPYERFVRLLNSQDGGKPADLATLMTKLRQDGRGVLRTRIVDGTRMRHAVVLTDQHDIAFYNELLDEFFTDMSESIVNPLPLASTIEKSFGPVPEDVLQTIPVKELGTVLFGESSGEGGADTPDSESDRSGPEKVIAIPSLNKDALLITRKNARPFMTIAILKLRYYLSNTTLLGLLAKLQDTSLLSLKQNCAGKEIPFWLALTKTIVSHIREIEALKNASVDKHFFHVAWLLKNLIEAQLTETEEKKRREEEEKVDLDAIAMAIKESPDRLVDQAALTAIIDSQKEKYGDRLEQFRERFYEQYVKNKDGGKLPRVVMLGTRYIHRDNIFPTFLEHFRLAETELRPFFVHLMEQQLRTGNRSREETFHTVENFEEAIHNQIRQKSEYLAEIVNKPAILAEGMIHHLKQKKLVKDVTELRQRLALYFDPETMKPLPLHQWFNLRLSEIFENAFSRLPVWQRLWIRITGKYESFRSRFIKQAAAAGSGGAGTSGRARKNRKEQSPARDNAHGPQKREPPRSRKRPGQSAEGRPYRSQSAAESASSPSASAAATKKKRSYDRKQVESAWEQFGSTIKKDD